MARVACELWGGLTTEPSRGHIEKAESPYFPDTLIFQVALARLLLQTHLGVFKRHRPWFELKKVLLARASAPWGTWPPQFAECIYLQRCFLVQAIPPAASLEWTGRNRPKKDLEGKLP